MKKNLLLCVSVFVLTALFYSGASAQITTVPTYKLVNSIHTSTDTLSGTDTAIFNKLIPGNYYTAVAAQWVHKSGSTDSCQCTLKQSVDGLSYVQVVGSTIKNFKSATETFIWDGGNVPWTCNYLQLYCLHKQTGKGALKVKLQLKK